MKSHWTIRYTTPVESPSQPGVIWNQNNLTGVVAETIDDAMAKIRDEMPHIRIYSVQHHGEIKYIA